MIFGRSLSCNAFDKLLWKLPSFTASSKSVSMSIVDIFFCCVGVLSNGQELLLEKSQLFCVILQNLSCACSSSSRLPLASFILFWIMFLLYGQKRSIVE